MLQIKCCFFFSRKSLFFIKKYTAPKLTLKSCLQHLNFSTLPSKKLSRIVAKNNTHLSYFKQLNFSYITFLQTLKNKQTKVTTFSLFLFLVEKESMYYLFDYAVFFWSRPLNILFHMEWVNKRGNPTPWIRYIPGKRRCILIWRWLGFTTRLLNTLYLDFLVSFFFLWELFFLSPVASSKLTSIKLRVYKIYMYKLY